MLVRAALVGLCVGLLAGCQTEPTTAPPKAAGPAAADGELIEAAGLPNLLRISENLYSRGTWSRSTTASRT
jgi:hypothetical protein